MTADPECGDFAGNERGATSWLKAIEDAIRAGEIDASGYLQDRANATDSEIGEAFDTDEEDDEIDD